MPRKTANDRNRPPEKRQSIHSINHRQQALEALKIAKQQEYEKGRIL